MTIWTESLIAELRRLWSLSGRDELSTAEIGRRLKASKNAVVGKVHRLNLPPRPSPIQRPGNAPAPRIPRMPRPVLIADAPPKRITRLPDKDGCKHVSGTRGAYLYCGAPIARGSYCAEHAALCYVSRKEAA